MRPQWLWFHNSQFRKCIIAEGKWNQSFTRGSGTPLLPDFKPTKMGNGKGGETNASGMPGM
jgi:hypothetical protein